MRLRASSTCVLDVPALHEVGSLRSARHRDLLEVLEQGPDAEHVGLDVRFGAALLGGGHRITERRAAGALPTLARGGRLGFAVGQEQDHHLVVGAFCL